MKLPSRLPALRGARSNDQHLMCPVCGQRGETADHTDTTRAAFVSRGEDRGYTAWKCYACGSGFVVHGSNTEPIPAEHWAQIEARYAEEHPDRIQTDQARVNPHAHQSA